jgi:hypothetical protein
MKKYLRIILTGILITIITVIIGCLFIKAMHYYSGYMFYENGLFRSTAPAILFLSGVLVSCTYYIVQTIKKN